MTQTEQLVNDLRDAIRDEILDELRAYRARLDDTYDPNYIDGIEDAINTLEQ